MSDSIALILGEQSDVILDTITKIAPIPFIIFGFLLVWKLNIKWFRGVAK